MKVAAIGGGTGLSATAGALRLIPETTISAIVATTDNGGSTGAIRRWSGCMAWGDLRHVINALSEYTNPTLQTLLFDYRFEKDEGALSGQSLGNIILHALENLAPRPQNALDLVTHWLNVDARIIPMSEEPSELVAEADQQFIEGEVEVDRMDTLPERLGLMPQVSATPEAVEAINQADLVVLGPGSVMTSIVPNLLVGEIAQSLKETPAKRVWVENLGREEGPMGQVSPLEKHSWLRGILGFRFADVILGDSSLDLTGIPGEVIQTDLKDSRRPDRYSQSRLSDIYRSLVKK